ncbi:SDR family oxidoreductase [Pontibacter silvestris]|uniref:dTDP-4-dehydrorhamnose reductase n=1 Tax=Pontibacter silvestris TaxID=2305183 RepID=A0ABW4WW10_9BACT|nr:family 1 glycosylhydrolase [Pontibacter silvestris]MCC9137027.1 sugar nucleotide-binding protein [Pontibacter silvestris]
MGVNSQCVEVWGGVECTFNRVKDLYFDQLQYADHYSRQSDLELFADLGIKKIRYPVIWEKHQPRSNTEIDWRLTENNLNKLRELNVHPIAGLVHHGSGPVYAPIHTDKFATGLASYALKVAEKFPWLEYYTPINEPLTTSRFCGLYGIWYPHHKENTSFLRLLINECKATVLAMQAIRTVNSAAKLVQTEDLGKTYSTPLLKYQADFENERRWLGFDLISGKIDSEHPLWPYLMWSGIKPKELAFFQENNCPIDILGFNYYPTSERFLDENLEKYPLHTHGGNHKHQYADVEAVRVNMQQEHGISVLLREAWHRFKTPMAVTEVHLGCTREEQLRWIKEIWDNACQLKEEGVDIRAITAWAMLGSYGWSNLLADENQNIAYEPGLFDLRSGKPRATALAKLIKGIATGQQFRHPVLEEKGWWKKEARILYSQSTVSKANYPLKSSQPLLIIGKTGTLGNAFARLCYLRGIHYELLRREELDITDEAQAESVIAAKKPWAVVNAAGYVKVDEAETNYSDCYSANTLGPANLALLANKYQFKLLTFSSDLVFNGQKKSFYTESDPVSALNVFGKTQEQAEKLVTERDPSALIIRTSALFGPWDSDNFVMKVLSSLKEQKVIAAANDLYISPTYIPDLVHASLDLLLDGECGIWHLANVGETTYASLASEVARLAGFDSGLVESVPVKQLGYKAVRPIYSVLGSERGLMLPSLEDAISRLFIEQEVIEQSPILSV